MFSQNFIFLSKFRFLAKISIFGQNFYFSPKLPFFVKKIDFFVFWFLGKFRFFCILIFGEISIFGQNFNFCQNVDFWIICNTYTQNLAKYNRYIVRQNFNLSPNFHFLVKFRVSDRNWIEFRIESFDFRRKKNRELEILA